MTTVTAPTLKIPPEGLPAFTDPRGVTMGQGRLSHQLFQRDQSWCYEAHWALCGRKLRVMVTRNAYDQQSFCKVLALDEDTTAWNFLVDLPFNAQRNCFKISYVNEGVDKDLKKFNLFVMDADDILEKACRILNPFYANQVESVPKAEGHAAPNELTAKITPALGAFVTKVTLEAAIYFSDGVVIRREIDR